MRNGEKTMRWPGSLYRPDRLFMRRDLMRRVENSAWRSEDFSHADWLKFFVTISSNHVGTLAPDGHQTADLMEVSGSSVRTDLAQYVNGGGSGPGVATVNAPLTLSVFAKKRDAEWLRLDVWDDTDELMMQWFDVATGTLGSLMRAAGAVGTEAQILDAGIDPYPHGWWRCWVVIRTGSDPSVGVDIGVAEADGKILMDGSGGIWIWGAQIEDNKDFVGPYVRTPVSAAVTQPFPQSLTKNIGDAVGADDAAIPALVRRIDAPATIAPAVGAWGELLQDAFGQLWVREGTPQSVIADATDSTAIGVKASYTVPAGKTATVNSASVVHAGVGGLPTVELQIFRGATVITIKSSTIDANFVDAGPITLLAADIIRLNVVSAGGGTRTADYQLSVTERP